MWLLAVLVAVLAGFISIRLLAQRASGEVDTAAERIVSVSNPAIQSLTSMRASVYQLELLLSGALDAGAPPDGPELETAVARLSADVQAYLDLPGLPDERGQRRVLHERHLRFHDEVIRLQGLLADGRTSEARSFFGRGVARGR